MYYVVYVQRHTSHHAARCAASILLHLSQSSRHFIRREKSEGTFPRKARCGGGLQRALIAHCSTVELSRLPAMCCTAELLSQCVMETKAQLVLRHLRTVVRALSGYTCARWRGVSTTRMLGAVRSEYIISVSCFADGVLKAREVGPQSCNAVCMLRHVSSTDKHLAGNAHSHPALHDDAAEVQEAASSARLPRQSVHTLTYAHLSCTPSYHRHSRPTGAISNVSVAAYTQPIERTVTSAARMATGLCAHSNSHTARSTRAGRVGRLALSCHC